MARLVIYDADDRLTRTEVTCHRFGSDTRLLPVSGGVTGLIPALDSVLRSSQTFNRILVSTHGNNGQIFFGANSINADWVNTNLHGRHYSSLCPTHTHIYFTGCRVAAEPGGRAFLASIGSTFLAIGGGSVGAHSEDGWALPIYVWLTGHVVNMGDFVRLFYGPGGVATGDRTESFF